MKRYIVTHTFWVEGDHTNSNVLALAEQAATQIEDPRDDDGERVSFQTSGVTTTVVRAVSL